jgi:hypothetical protein
LRNIGAEKLTATMLTKLIAKPARVTGSPRVESRAGKATPMAATVAPTTATVAVAANPRV